MSWGKALLILLGLGALALGAPTLLDRAGPVPDGARPAAGTPEQIERGRQLALAGNCAVCHTARGGAPYAGGRAIGTPFGTVYAGNLTPDEATGLGRWSADHFWRALHEGRGFDGRRLVPAFPYTEFTRLTRADSDALYAWLRTLPPVAQPDRAHELRWPYGTQTALAAWRLAFFRAGSWVDDASKSAEWNRGAYLVNGLGHCGACHTPRNAFGAEQDGSAHLSGAVVDGWEAPPLTALSHAPLPWTEADLFDYLRHGHSARHGSATGPMAPVVQQLAQLPDADVRAMATYLVSFNDTAPTSTLPAQAPPANDAAHRLFTTACGACHHDGSGPLLLGQNIALERNTNLHSARPDNLLRVILEGVQDPASPQQGFMPSFRDAFDDAQVAQLAAYLRQRFAPQQPAWRDLEAASRRVRATPSSH